MRWIAAVLRSSIAWNEVAGQTPRLDVLAIAGAWARNLTPLLYPIQLCVSTPDLLSRPIRRAALRGCIGRLATRRVPLGSAVAPVQTYSAGQGCFGVGRSGRMWGIGDGVLVGRPV